MDWEWASPKRRRKNSIQSIVARVQSKEVRCTVDRDCAAWVSALLSSFPFRFFHLL